MTVNGTLTSVTITVAFIGAGSVEFTRNVVTDLCGYPEFRGDLHFALYDISAERLAHAERLARRISEQSGAGATVTATTDRRTALAGARYVINEVQVGGYAATRADFDIPARYGVRQTIGDTLGIGGIFRGLRTIPVTVALARTTWPRSARTPTCSATATRWPCCPGRCTRAARSAGCTACATRSVTPRRS